MTSKAGHTAGPWATYFVSGHAIQRCDRTTGHVVRDVAYCDTPERASELTEAFTIAHETGLTPRQLAERCKELEAALEFYADRRRYEGPNQRPIEGDKFAQPNDAYLRDVTRDGGHIAAVALRAKATAGGAV